MRSNVIFIEEKDNEINPLGKGIVGTAAIANAVYHAVGKRVCDLPITIDKLTFARGPNGGLLVLPDNFINATAS